MEVGHTAVVQVSWYCPKQHHATIYRNFFQLVKEMPSYSTVLGKEALFWQFCGGKNYLKQEKWLVFLKAVLAK